MTAEIIDFAAERMARLRPAGDAGKPAVAPPPEAEPPDPLRGLYGFGAPQSEAKP